VAFAGQATADRRKVKLLRCMISAYGPRLTTCTLQQVVSYLGYTGHQTNVVVTAAHDPTASFQPARNVSGYWGDADAICSL
jgi:hypothetical protein